MKGINWWERPRRIPGQHLFPSAFSQSYCISPLLLHKFEFWGKLTASKIRVGSNYLTFGACFIPGAVTCPDWSNLEERTSMPWLWKKLSQSLTAETRKQLVVIKHRAILKIKLAQNGGNTEKEFVSLLILSINRWSGYLLYRSFHHPTFSYVRQQIFWGK